MSQDVPDGGTRIGFREVGDEVLALKSDNGYTATWRTGSILARVYSFSSDIDLGIVEDFAEALQRALTKS